MNDDCQPLCDRHLGERDPQAAEAEGFEAFAERARGLGFTDAEIASMRRYYEGGRIELK